MITNAYLAAKTPESKAKEILKLYWDGNLPIVPGVIAKNLGFEVIGVANPDYSGKAYLANGKSIIEYNNSDHPLRQRFTVAHECGHHVLGHTQNGHQFRDYPSEFSLSVTVLEEVQANKFAAEILAPEIAIRHCIFDQKITSIKKLAEKFLVSQVAMKYRLTNLGLI